MTEIHASLADIRIDGKMIGKARDVTVSAEPSEEVEVRDFDGSHVARYPTSFDLTVEMELTAAARDVLAEVMRGGSSWSSSSHGEHVHVSAPGFPRARPEPLREIVGVSLQWRDGKYFLALEFKQVDPASRETEIVGVICDPLVIHDFIREMEENQ
jgi:hypothetical protein